MSSDYKPSEPVTFVTDMAMAILAVIFGSILLYYWIKMKEKRKKESLMWVGLYFSVALFAFFGALSHVSTSIIIGDLLWPPTMIFGGITFIFIVAGVIIYQKETNFQKLLIIPIILVIIYLILAVLLNWMFFVWVLLLLLCSVFIFYFSFKAKAQNKQLAPYLIYGLVIILIAGAVQAIGGILQWRMMVGPNNEYLVQPHNDIFHIIAMIGMYLLFKGFKKEYL